MHIHSVREADPLKYNLLDSNLKGSIDGLMPYCEFMVYLGHSFHIHFSLSEFVIPVDKFNHNTSVHS